MPPRKSKSKSRTPEYALQAQERRSARQVAIHSMETSSAPVQGEGEQGVTTPNFSTTNVVVDDGQRPSSSSGSAVNQADVPTNMDTPTRSEFLELKEQIATLTATISSLNANNNLQASNRLPVLDNDTTGVVNQRLNTDNSHSSITNDLPVNVMQQAVDEHLQTIMGNSASSGEVGSFNDASRAVDMKVTDKVKQLIWSNQYVDLTLLIDKSLVKQQSFELVSSQGQLTFAPAKNSRAITSLGKWCDAFIIYLTIYCKKYPNAISKLTSYMSSVKTLAFKGGDFVYYDQEFRYLRQTQNIPWDQVHPGLWLECRDNRSPNQNSKNNSRNRSNNQSFRAPNTTNKSSSKHPIGYCFAFHSRGQCIKSNCTFKHNCYVQSCNGKHPVFKCNKRGQVNSGASTPPNNAQTPNPNKN